MPIFEIQGQDGNTYEVDAPTMEAAATAFAQVDQQGAGNSTDTITDVAKSFGSGLVKGVEGIAAIPGNLQALTARGIDTAAEWAGINGPRVTDLLSVARKYPMLGVTTPPTSADIRKEVGKVTGELHAPETTAGQYAETVGTFAPGVVAGPGGFAQRALSLVVAPAIASETAGQLTKGTAAEPYARMGGAMAGAYAPAAAGRLVTPVPAVSAERTRLAGVLADEGVTSTTAGQRTGNEALRGMESHLGALPLAGGRPAAMREAASEEFTQAALRRVGEDARRATPEVLDNAFDRIGQAFQDVISRNTLRLDRQLNNDLANVTGRYYALVPQSHRAPIIENTVHDIANMRNAGRVTLGGEAYQALRSRLDRAGRAARQDPQLSEAIYGLRNALDDAMERTLTTADRELWRNARREYRNLLVVERAAAGAGENAAAGALSPSQLRAATANQNKRNYVRGEGDFADLARAGEAILKPLPQSGTPWRTAAQTMMTGVGAGAGGMMFGAPGAGAGAMLGAVAPSIAGRAIMNPLIQQYLGNQVFGNYLRNLNSRQAAILSALIASGQLPAKQ